MEIYHKHFTSIGSTNLWAKENAHSFPRHQLTLISADEQTAGRGRFNRSWVSPANQNIYASYGLFLRQGRPDIGNIPQILAISTCETLLDLEFSPQLKWPNDILIDKKKVAGILCETKLIENLLFVVIGIGLNVNMDKNTIQQIDRPATSLMIEGGVEYDRKTVLEDLTKRFVSDLARFLKEGFSPFHSRYEHLLIHEEGDEIKFHHHEDQIIGKFEKILPDGSLSLLLPNGQKHRFISGEIN